METRPGTDPGASYDPKVQTPPAEKASVVEDFIDIFHAPTSVFARRATSGYGMQLLIVSIISALFMFANRGVISQIMDAEFTRATAKMMAENPQLTQEQMAAGRGIQNAIGSTIGYIGTPIFIFVMAFLAWLVAKLVSAKVTYSQAVMITTLAWIPRLLGSLLMTVQVALMDTSNVTNMFALSASPARFMNPDATNPKVFGLMGSLEVFAIWFAILMGIGISVMAKVPRGRGYLVAAIVFVIATIPMLMR